MCIEKDPEMAEAVMLTAIDVSEGDGEIEPEERVVLERMAKELGQNLDNLLAA